MPTKTPTYHPIAPVSSLFTSHSSLAEMHAFSAKERDTETGLSYFGARYYSSELSIWLSVDPMSGKYPSLSPYVYCADNPMKLVDPNGEYPIKVSGGTMMFYSKTSVGAGVGYSVSGNYYSGRAYDKSGVTRFSATSSNYFTNQNLKDGATDPSFFAGTGIGIGANVAYFRGAKSFKDAANRSFLSIGGGEGLGASLGFGEGVVSIGLGLDLGGGLDYGKMTVNKSISLSYAEVDKINDLSDVVSPSWSVGDITPKKNKEGEVIGYNGTVYTTDSRGNKINTKISVSSGVGKDGKKNNQWLSKDYENGLK